jgi:predicted membrane protein
MAPCYYFPRAWNKADIDPDAPHPNQPIQERDSARSACISPLPAKHCPPLFYDTKPALQARSLLESPEHGTVMSDINELKDKVNTKTLNMVLLSIATAGIYLLLWLYKSNQKINETTKIKVVDDTYVIWVAVCLGWSGALSNLGDVLFDSLSGILLIALNALYIVWAFKAKNALSEYALNEHKIDLRMNGFYTFFLNIFYVNYCINDLPEEQRKQLILRGQTTQA